MLTQDAAFSPDGEWLAYRWDNTGTEREQVYMRRSPARGPEVPLTEEGGSYPMWSRNGKVLFYRRGLTALAGATTTRLIVVEMTSLDPPQWTNERPLPIEGFLVYAG